jgi:CD109 antigen
MIALVPNIAVLNYLNNINRLTAATNAKLRAFIEVGYITQLNFQRYDGSFSCFGNSDNGGNTWLTALVVRYFVAAKKYVYIDDNVIQQATNWLVMGRQRESGEFFEEGRAVHNEMQGDASQGVALTAYTMISILSIPNATVTYKDNLNRAAAFIVSKMPTLDQLYSLALAAYALQMVDNPAAPILLAKFNSKAIERDSLKWWEKPKPQGYTWSSNAIDVEITAYGLLANMKSGLDTSNFLIMKWLLKQRNSMGGFSSTQDTIVSIEALTKIAESIQSNDLNMDVTITDDTEMEYRATVTNENSFVLQSNELNSAARKVGGFKR